MIWSNYEEVEYVFGLTFTPDQREMVATYIFTGVRPDNGTCWVCSEGYIRTVTGDMDNYEKRVLAGEENWPWGIPASSSE